MIPGSAPLVAGAGAAAARNPTTITLISVFCCFYYGLFQCMKTEEELNNFLGKSAGGNILWMLFPLIPALSMPKLMAEARARAGTPAQGEGSLIMYILLPYYAFIKDANEVLGRPNGLPLGAMTRRYRALERAPAAVPRGPAHPHRFRNSPFT